jgi:hypothetical protein
MIEVFLTAIYIFLFIIIINKNKLFNINGISQKTITVVFILKIISGLILWWIYTFYYTDRIRADIYKYFDDSKALYNLLFEDPLAFLQILFGINSDPEKYHYVFDRMYNWYSPFETHIYNANRPMIRINAIIHIFSFGYFNVHTVFFCFLSLIGQLYLFKAFYPYLKDKKWGLLVAVFLLPAVLFWGSGVLKEAIILLGLGIFIYSLFEMVFVKANLRNLSGIIIGLVLIGLMKTYIIITLFPGIILLLIVKFSDLKFLMLKYFGIIIFMIGFAYVMGLVTEFYNPAQMLSFRQKDFYNSVNGGIYFFRFKEGEKDFQSIFFPPSKLPKFKGVERNDTIQINFTDTAFEWDFSNYKITDTIIISANDNRKYRLIFKDTILGSTINIPELEPNYLSMIKNAPMAFLNTLARPHPFEVDSVLMLIACVENLFLMAVIIFSLFFIQIPQGKTRLVFFFSLSFTLMLFILTGLVTPVIGAIVRYKMPALPFLIISLLLIIDLQKMQTFFTKIRQ